jgi:hypothetical protein
MISRRMAINLVALGAIGCASIDSSHVRARAGAPESARVERLEIPYDATLPRYALVVETFVAEGPVSETKVRTHQFSEQHGKQFGTTESKGSATGTIQDTVRDREKWSAESQNKALAMGKAPETPDSARHPMVSDASLSSEDTIQPIAAARSQGNIAGQRDQNYSREIQSELSGRGTIKHSRRQDLSQHTDGAIDVTQRTWQVSRRDIDIAAQFTSSLAGVQNFVLLSPAAAKPVGDGIYQARVPNGAVGPFIVKALVTEEVHEVEGRQSRIFVPGVISSKYSELQGVVVMDVTVLDGRTGALVAAFPAEGTFISQDKRFSAGVILPLAEQHAFARSVASQAQRVALNQAAVKILEAFRNYSSL